tara:strand:- start:33 stop:755 length:723 start_codon:yes stop_codon:yes gene_type:complete
MGFNIRRSNMADKPKTIPFMINQVEALYPRLDKTYRFDSKEKRSVPCDVFDDGAKYEVGFRMTSDQAKKLFSQMKTAYSERAGDDWPEKFDNPFTKEEGTYKFKSSLKGAYDKDATRKPIQYDASNTKLPDDFLLTTGSTINIAGVCVPYHAKGIGTGVSLRLGAVQVTNYVPMQMSSPFEATEGFEADNVNPFQSMEELEVSEEEVVEEIVEPKKVAKKSASVKAKDPEIDAIVDDWDD